MFPSETVTIVKTEDLSDIGLAPYGEVLYAPDGYEDVPGVLVAPGAPEDIDGSIRPEGVRVAYTLYFPKTYTEPLRHMEIIVRGRRCRVIGDPQEWRDPPGKRNRVVMVEAIDG